MYAGLIHRLSVSDNINYRYPVTLISLFIITYIVYAAKNHALTKETMKSLNLRLRILMHLKIFLLNHFNIINSLKCIVRFKFKVGVMHLWHNISPIGLNKKYLK